MCDSAVGVEVVPSVAGVCDDGVGVGDADAEQGHEGGPSRYGLCQGHG